MPSTTTVTVHTAAGSNKLTSVVGSQVGIVNGDPISVSPANLSPPTNLSFGPSGSGLWNGGNHTFYWQVTAVNALGETTGSTEFSSGLSSDSLAPGMNWVAVPGAVTYNLYRAQSSGGESGGSHLVASGITGTRYVDHGNALSLGGVPAVNTAAKFPANATLLAGASTSTWTMNGIAGSTLTGLTVTVSLTYVAPPAITPPARWPGFPLRQDDRLRRVGATPPPLPVVATLPGLVLDTTDVELLGSVNPNGIPTNAWFVWGTTAQWGNVTPTTFVGNSTFPSVVSFKLTGLTPDVEIHFAMVAQSSSGTVYGQDVIITPTFAPPVVTPASVPVPTGQPTVAQPHLAFPFKMHTNGASVFEQDTLEEVFACVYAIASCTLGECPELPEFGIPDQVFATAAANPDAVMTALRTLEPRASEQTVIFHTDDAGRTLMRFDVQLNQATGGTAT